MRVLSVFILSVILFNSHVLAQGTLLFCESVSPDGKAINSFESFIVPPQGQTIQLLYHSTAGPIGTAQLKLEIAELIDHSFKKTGLESVLTDPTKELVKIPFHLKSAGDYRFRLTDQKGTLLAEEILSVSVEMREAGRNRESQNTLVETDIPELVDLQFSDPEQAYFNSEFSFRGTRGKVRLTLDPFDDTDPVRIIDIWQSENDQYKKFIRSEKVNFVKDGDVGIYELSFPSMNDFKVDVHNADNTLITSGFVSFK